MDVSSAIMPSDEPFHSPASFNMISIAAIYFAYGQLGLIQKV